MGTIHASDVIFATLIQHGRQIGSFRLSGISSLSDIIDNVRSKAARVPGIVTLQLRNGTQGWTHRHPCIIF
ncbi:MAG: hypothetical protein HDS41_04440 [Bacteroides sp.]|nr:hypothetical protein [Bacteroides sp.]